MSDNQLGSETSPYLLQHRDNPVHWRAWGEAAFAEARAANKPILLSVGYAACHWCHVMAHESFEDAKTAAVMNELFVNIKVDREERPDVDAIYQSALAMMGEQGGWPLTMFLTPKGEPFWGGTYFPPTPRYGRAAFRDVLTGLAEAWARKQDQVQKNVAALVGALQQRNHAPGPGQLDAALLDQIALRLLEEVDTVHGGIGGAPKFPQPAIFELLWRAYRRTDNAEFKQAVTITLDRMSQGGIYDHLGGGYARYSTDPHWLVPHFEKMLYDNAALLENLTLVWAETKAPLYAARVDETVGWLTREMMAEGGAFASTLDADSEGEEGKFYVWRAEEIDALLGKDAPLFKEAYDVTPEGNWEGHTILNRSRKMLLGSPSHEAQLAKERAILFAEREKRIRPGRDDKVLGDWNGMMIAALARAGFVFARADWIALAVSAYDGVLTLLRDEGGRLHHSYRQGRRAHPATLDDHAQLARAGVMLFEVTGETRFLTQAEKIVALADTHYWDTEAGGYFFTADDARDLITRTRHAHDNATPSGNGTMAQVLTRLYHHTGQTSYRDRAAAVVAAFAGELTRNFFPLATLLNAAELLEKPLQVVLVGEDDSLAGAVRSVSLPNLVLSRVTPGRNLPAEHPAHGKGLVAGLPAAYVCEGPVCSAPFTDATMLLADLKQR